MVEFDPQQVSLEQVVSKITNLGYEAKKKENREEKNLAKQKRVKKEKRLLLFFPFYSPFLFSIT